MKTRNDCEIACDCVKRANVVLHVGLCEEIFARKHTATHKPTSSQPLSAPLQLPAWHTSNNRLWSPLAYGLGGNYPYFWASSKASFCCLFVWFFVWSQTELLQFPSDDHLHFSCCRSPRVFKRSLSKQRNLCGSDQSLYMYLCRRVYWTPLPKWWVVSMLINCWHVKGSVEWSRHERHFCSLLPYHCDFKLALTKKSRPCRGTFARANQADRCMNWLHCAQRSTPWLLE